MKVRSSSSSRGLKITSLVVLSPVLLILFSLVYIFLVFVYSNVMSWCRSSTIQPLSSSQSLMITRMASTAAVTARHCPNKIPQLTILKRINFFSRLRQSPLVWCVILLIYALYTVHKKKKNNSNNKEDDPDLLSYQGYTETITKPKQSKRRKTKNKQNNHQNDIMKPSTGEERHYSTTKIIRSATTAIVRTPETESEEEDDENIWISVGEIRKKKNNSSKSISPPLPSAPEINNVHKTVISETVITSSSLPVQPNEDIFYEEEVDDDIDQGVHDVDNINDNSNIENVDDVGTNDTSTDDSDCQSTEGEEEEEDSSIDLNLMLPSMTPITDEKKKPKSWYSPFSTGLDLDILQKRPDPFVQYKFDSFVPQQQHYPITDLLQYRTCYPSNIELLENHPFIPTSKNENGTGSNTLGPIGESVRSCFHS